MTKIKTSSWFPFANSTKQLNSPDLGQEKTSLTVHLAVNVDENKNIPDYRDHCVRLCPVLPTVRREKEETRVGQLKPVRSLAPDRCLCVRSVPPISERLKAPALQPQHSHPSARISALFDTNKIRWRPTNGFRTYLWLHRPCHPRRQCPLEEDEACRPITRHRASKCFDSPKHLSSASSARDRQRTDLALLAWPVVSVMLRRYELRGLSSLGTDICALLSKTEQTFSW
ncbi:hypothetical protein LZ30DRAFT_474370 [Colletotrichum cereale]|nr:hypothetical protein LZ30DRAFT_474370 [Colletotrichum cereale]